MTVDDFVTKAKKQDSRNHFESFDGDVSSIPLGIAEFYIKANPIDVEVETRKLGSVHFYPVEEIEGLRNEYSFMPKDVFIFATNNGDPIFIQNDRFFITYESRYKPEPLSESFGEFLDYIKVR